MPCPTRAPVRVPPGGSPQRSPAPTDAAAVQPLSIAPIGRPCLVTGVDGPDRAELEREGILPGTVVVVAARTPLGGPLVVQLGRARLALSARTARQVAARILVPLDQPTP